MNGSSNDVYFCGLVYLNRKTLSLNSSGDLSPQHQIAQDPTQTHVQNLRHPALLLGVHIKCTLLPSPSFDLSAMWSLSCKHPTNLQPPRARTMRQSAFLGLGGACPIPVPPARPGSPTHLQLGKPRQLPPSAEDAPLPPCSSRGRSGAWRWG